MRGFHLLCGLLLVTCLNVPATLAASGDIHNLGTIGGTVSEGYAVNDAGQVAGYSYAPGDVEYHAFLYTGTPGSGGAMADLGTFGGGYSQGFGINASGQVTGYSWTSLETHAFRYTGTPGSGGAM